MVLANVCIVGAGAVGILVSDGLSRTLGKASVRVLADSDRTGKYIRDGLFLNGKRMDFNYVSFEQNRSLPKADLVIIATKNPQLHEVVDGLNRQIAPGCIIMSLLNGIVSEEILQSAFPEAHVLYCFAKGLDSERDGNSITCTARGETFAGEKDGSMSAELEAVRSLFVRCGLGIQTPPDIMHELYSKFALNCAINTVSAICNAGYGDFSACQSIDELIDGVFSEVKAVSLAHAGVRLLDDEWKRTKVMISSLSYEGKTSMLQDMQAPRPTENAWFCGTVIELGHRYGIPTPLCHVLYLAADGCEFTHLRRFRKQ
jgi:2-dehydropantoate 2-reductase